VGGERVGHAGKMVLYFVGKILSSHASKDSPEESKLELGGEYDLSLRRPVGDLGVETSLPLLTNGLGELRNSRCARDRDAQIAIIGHGEK